MNYKPYPYFMTRKKILFASIIIVAGGAVAFLLWRSNNMPYELVPVQRGSIVQEVSASGTVEPLITVDLQFKNSGKITNIRAMIGQEVQAGDVLMEQDTSVLMSQLKQLESELVNQEYKLKTVRKDETKKTDAENYLIGSQKAIIEKAKADVRAQQARIDETVITSPIDGVITAVNVEVGEISKPEAIAVSIMSSDAPHIDVYISETTIANVRVGQEARITLDAFDGNEVLWTGKVVDIDPAGTVRGGAVYYRATVAFDRADERIKPGMTASVWVRTAAAENVLFVPVSAIQKQDGKQIVRVLSGKQSVNKDVTTRLKSATGMIEILAGLEEGEQIILGNKEKE